MTEKVAPDISVPPGHAFSYEVETTASEAARLDNERKDKDRERLLHTVTYLVVMVLILGIVGLVVYLRFFAANQTAETIKWCETVLSAVLTGTISFAIGRKFGK